jgi:CheY-like chemotaxis protein
MEAIGTLAGGIAHDFNNILSAIIGYAELSMMEIPEASEAKHNLEEVRNATRRARDLVKQILAFSHQTEQEKKPVQIKPIVKEAIKLLRASLPTTIEISQHVSPDAGIIVADPTQIHQLMMNLCTNAAHAMEEKGGTLAISLTNVDVDSATAALHIGLESRPYLKLTVSDTGHGMTSDVMERIFEPYFSTREKGEGTGMGLAVVHGIVKSHGGTITVDSNPGQGSTFNVYIPQIEKEESPEPELIEVIPPGRERILFVDDEDALVILGKKILEKLGYTVTTRTSSMEALELFRAQPDGFDFVITDMTMPNMTGDRLAKELLEIRNDIPILLCTGYSERISKEKANQIGICDFVMKPLEMGNLARTIRNVLDSN